MIGELLQGLDYFGTAVFAITGALVADRKRMDLMGFLILATVTGIGGGTLRDLLLDRPVFWLTQWEYLVITAVMAIAFFYVGRPFRQRAGWLPWADAVGLSAFCVIGVQIALSMNANPMIAVMMGIMTATFGGLIRDVLAGESPLLLHREIYASAALIGGIVYVLFAQWLDWPIVAVIAGFAVTLAVRGLGIRYHWHLPSANG
ncbi:MAG: trimeric intracellular cation channel family protein [Halothiobacillaceae bacterium]|nr:trimeric intracellular cation channel family protein [Halothiobacillaceae bacterium]HER34650.1 trimeric intracellular cation channel family protein [Halothiobacillaceae bacterium]